MPSRQCKEHGLGLASIKRITLFRHSSYHRPPPPALYCSIGLCTDTWKMGTGEREKRIAEKGRTHQLPSSCPRRSSCTQKRLRCRHTHRQPAWFEIQNMCAVTRALIGGYGYTHQASLAAHMHVMCYIELYLISLFVTLYIYIQISCR